MGSIRAAALLVVLSTYAITSTAVVAAQPRRVARAVPGAVATVAALTGPATVAAAAQVRPLGLHDAVASGEEIITGAGACTDMLLGARALLSIEPGSRVGIAGPALIDVIAGAVRLASPASAGAGEPLVIQTPSAMALVRGTLLRVAVVPAPAAETFEVLEGGADISSTGPAGGSVRIAAGESLTITGGRLGTARSGVAPADDRCALAADQPHANTPERGRRQLVALQVSEAEALAQVLRGADQRSVSEPNRARDDAIIATQGVTTGAGQSNVTTVAEPTDGGFFGQGINPFARAVTRFDNRSGSGLADDLNDGPNRLSSPTDPVTNQQVAVAASVELNVSGGAGLLLFTQRNPLSFVAVNPDVQLTLSDFTLTSLPPTPNRLSLTTANGQPGTELMLVDGGERALAPHGGTAPTSTLIARGVSGTNRKLPLQDGVDPAVTPFGPKKFAAVNPPPDQGAFIDPERFLRANAFVVVARSPQDATRLIHDDSLDTEKGPVPAGSPTAVLADFSSESEAKRGNACTFCSGQLAPPRLDSHVDGAITARSPVTGDRLVTLNGGVVLDERTALTVGVTKATSEYFAARSGLDPAAAMFDGSALAILASQDGGFNPAIVKINDRALAVQGGSTIAPETATTRVALLSVLDSHLTGPEPTDTAWRAFRDTGPPPLIEIVDSNPPPSADAGVTVTSAVVVRSTGLMNGVALDRALLEASAPLVALVNSTMTTSGHFIDVSGAGPSARGLLSANLAPGDALIRLDASRLVVNGNLLNVTNGAAATITGALFSLTNSSSLTVNGALVRVGGAGSVFTLNGNSLGAFGTGTNTLTVANGLCGASACRTIGNIPVFAPGVADLSQVVQFSGNAAAFRPFSVPPGTPIPVAGTPSNVTLNVRPNDAFLQIDAGGLVRINPR